MRKAVQRLSAPSRLSSPGMGCALAAAAGGLSFVALEADAGQAVSYNKALGIMVGKPDAGSTIKAFSVTYLLPIRATSTVGAQKAFFSFSFGSKSLAVGGFDASGQVYANGASHASWARKITNGTISNIGSNFWWNGFVNGSAGKGYFVPPSPRGYVGIRFKADVQGSGTADYHVGWIDYEGSASLSGKVHAYAYKVAVNTPIKAAGPRAEVLKRSGGALSWKAVSEEGVARYEVEARGSDGSWSPVATVLPGKADYQVEGLGSGACRLVSVGVDGNRENTGEF